MKLVEQKENKSSDLTNQMYAAGADPSQLAQLQQQKDKLEADVEELMGEWEQLEVEIAEAEALLEA